MAFNRAQQEEGLHFMSTEQPARLMQKQGHTRNYRKSTILTVRNLLSQAQYEVSALQTLKFSDDTVTNKLSKEEKTL